MRHEELTVGLLRSTLTPIGTATTPDNPTGNNSSERSSLLALSCSLASVAAASCVEQNLTVNGVQPTDRFVVLGSTYAVAGAPAIQARCAVAGTLIVMCNNPTAAPIVPGVSILQLLQIRQDARN